MTKQPNFVHYECSECDFDSIQHISFSGSDECPLCAGDTGHYNRMKQRTALSTDTVEGKDARALAEFNT